MALMGNPILDIRWTHLRHWSKNHYSSCSNCDLWPTPCSPRHQPRLVFVWCTGHSRCLCDDQWLQIWMCRTIQCADQGSDRASWSIASTRCKFSILTFGASICLQSISFPSSALVWVNDIYADGFVATVWWSSLTMWLMMAPCRRARIGPDAWGWSEACGEIQQYMMAIPNWSRISLHCASLRLILIT